jgi:hypothetical protein
MLLVLKLIDFLNLKVLAHMLKLYNLLLHLHHFHLLPFHLLLLQPYNQLLSQVNMFLLLNFLKL